MSGDERNGQRRTREQISKRRVPELGYYFVVTDTKETEQNYMFGLRDSIPEHLQRKLVIKVSKSKTSNLVEEALNLTVMQPQYGEPWIVFDRDQVVNFDEIITEAEKEGIKVGWSNPCIEIWFGAYFGVMPTYPDSVRCCNKFKEIYKQITGQKYQKSDDTIYAKLCRYGDEKKAVSCAKQKLTQHIGNCNQKPSEMCPATTVHLLVEEIKNKIIGT
ncbi:MAG: RloB family protein [Eubacteriales bacterium]|nr:RloB family protein [Eubacteriales bacterium]